MRQAGPQVRSVVNLVCGDGDGVQHGRLGLRLIARGRVERHRDGRRDHLVVVRLGDPRGNGIGADREDGGGGGSSLRSLTGMKLVSVTPSVARR